MSGPVQFISHNFFTYENLLSYIMEKNRKNKIQEKVKELESIIKYFEEAEIDLDLAVEKYEKAAKLVTDLNSILKEYETRINKISSPEL
ncbi:MAG: hypothetical protein US52_C0009G0008 [candidate division WS6 bacterium GW2011_GWA2_37_6]|uniref:Exodeoxyribonuclease VII small subunit n=1 Tax=candidate division WS6 bacterium GW2011_GWA2_37_6 TaxID=1619087 RepID=A0A0G0K640_9BACT|nr:MAG: hypothetical protein US52_C0009G0008 [candidate division WS6 bacterium GW2011_GWA2_37_6]